uniref:Ovule protein n=1 Tax=Ascaris lumbricoides TaxID=6252 RepID=A0A0M3I724_ASCLU
METDATVQTSAQDEPFEVSSQCALIHTLTMNYVHPPKNIIYWWIPLKTKPLARAAKLITVTSEQRVPPRHRSRKVCADLQLSYQIGSTVILLCDI